MKKEDIDFCEVCAKKILPEWKGWPHKHPIPLLPMIVDGECEVCGSCNPVSSDRIKWLNYHSEYNTGLPDYWLLKIDDGIDKWGLPYYARGECLKCHNKCVISQMVFSKTKEEYKKNCENCGVRPFI